MADDSELDYIRTFLGLVHTTATVKHRQEIGKISSISDASGEKILVFPGELLSVSDSKLYTKRYMVQLSETSEAGMMGMLNDIIEGCYKMNNRIAITSFTRNAVMKHGEVKYSNKPYFNKATGRWDMDIFMDFTWGIA